MEWTDAENRIQTRVRVGADLNTSSSTYRRVLSVDVPIDSARYGYRGERGFEVAIGQTNRVKIPWSMLEECFAQLSDPDGYSGAFFRKRFPVQVRDHPCLVHVVGQLLVAAGLAWADGRTYHLRKE